ncbi:MAG: hypothetical protein KAH32_08570 [Chlamydiia bacterium]|nr:hypothetical protein [Chlamydiia bacterium]
MEIVFGLALLIALGVWGGNNMEKKGRSVLAGFALGFLLSWIGIIITYAVSDKTK